MFNGTQQFDDQKYQDAVSYAKAQIQREMQKKQQMNQFYNEALVSYPSDRMQNFMQSYEQQQQQPFRQFQNQDLYQEQPVNYNAPPYNGGGLPPSVKNMERQITNKSTAKSLIEMNSQQRKVTKQANHNFNYESEDDQRQKEQKGFKRAQSAKKIDPNNPPEYLKNTVNADLKRGNQATISKTKQVIVDAEKQFKEQYTFEPQINDFPLPPSKEVSKEERWKKLTEPKATEQMKRDKIKAQIEIEETQKLCPFKPIITSKSMTRSAKKGNQENEDMPPLPERLMHEADLRKEKREKMKKEREMEMMKECSFKPRLLSTSSSVVNINKYNTQNPIHERVNELQKEKNEKLQKLRMKSEQEQQDLTFQPQVNKKSAKIAAIKRQEEESKPVNVIERLYKDANDRIEKNMNYTTSYNEQLNREYSFQPQISKSSNYISEKSDLFNGNLKDFYERQQAFIQKQMEKKEEFRQKYSQEAQCSFKPEINVTSEIICEADPKRGGETEDEKIMRLYKKDQKKQEVVREILEKEMYEQYTYKPQINKISKTLAKGTTIEELAYNPKGREKKEKLQEELMTQNFNDCTFRPQTTKNKKYDKVQSAYSIADCSTAEDYSKKLKDKLKEKQERIAQERRQREYEALKDCTFKPQILEKEPSTSKDQVVVVRGLGRHLELKELQKKKEEDQKLREAEVFGLNHKFAVNAEEMDITNPQRQQYIRPKEQPSTSYTIPEPFDLSQPKQEKKKQVLKQIKEKEMSECTFKPSTNEGRNKKLIKEILEENENKENDIHNYQ